MFDCRAKVAGRVRKGRWGVGGGGGQEGSAEGGKEADAVDETVMAMRDRSQTAPRSHRTVDSLASLVLPSPRVITGAVDRL